MPGSDRPNVLKVAQSVPGAWPTIPALMRLMSSQATFEPVSAKTQPVSGHTTCQIPDIENSCSRDSSRKTPPSVGSARFSSPKTRPLPANPRECRRFSHTWKSHRRDRTGWLGRQDSNLGMAESKSAALPLGYAPKSAGPYLRKRARSIARPPRVDRPSHRRFPAGRPGGCRSFVLAAPGERIQGCWRLKGRLYGCRALTSASRR
jgi:hypothetical protein